MKKNIYILILFAFFFENVSAQAPQKIWEAFFTGTQIGKDYSNDIITDTSGNIYVTGRAFNNFSGGSLTTVKYDVNGVQLWDNHFANSQASYFNYGSHLVLDKWQNVYSVGTSAINDGDLTICKYNANGRIWAKNYEPYWFASFDDYGIDIDVDSSGNFYAIARVNSPNGNLFDMYLIKCDSSGTKIWDSNYSGASENDFPVAIAVTPGGTAYPLLQSFNFFGTSTMDVTTIQYLNNGTQNWSSKYNGLGNAEDYPMYLKVDQYENQYLCGTTDAGTNNDMVAIKQNVYGTRLWVVTYDGTAQGNDTAIATTWLPNGFVAVAGKSKELVNGIPLDATITILVDSGTIVWTHRYLGSDSLGATPKQMVTDTQGNIYICGTENLQSGTKNAFLIKYDSNGNLVWNISYDGGNNLNDIFNALIFDSAGDIILTGQTYITPSNADFLTVKYSGVLTGIQNYKSEAVFLVYPNPANDIAYISFNTTKNSPTNISITDLSGREIRKLNVNVLQEGINNLQLNLEDFASGMYLIGITGRNISGYKKLFVK